MDSITQGFMISFRIWFWPWVGRRRWNHLWTDGVDYWNSASWVQLLHSPKRSGGWQIVVEDQPTSNDFCQRMKWNCGIWMARWWSVILFPTTFDIRLHHLRCLKQHLMAKGCPLSFSDQVSCFWGKLWNLGWCQHTVRCSEFYEHSVWIDIWPTQTPDLASKKEVTYNSDQMVGHSGDDQLVLRWLWWYRFMHLMTGQFHGTVFCRLMLRVLGSNPMCRANEEDKFRLLKTLFTIIHSKSREISFSFICFVLDLFKFPAVSLASRPVTTDCTWSGVQVGEWLNSLIWYLKGAHSALFLWLLLIISTILLLLSNNNCKMVKHVNLSLAVLIALFMKYFSAKSSFLIMLLHKSLFYYHWFKRDMIWFIFYMMVFSFKMHETVKVFWHLNEIKKLSKIYFFPQFLSSLTVFICLETFWQMFQSTDNGIRKCGVFYCLWLPNSVPDFLNPSPWRLLLFRFKIYL